MSQTWVRVAGQRGAKPWAVALVDVQTDDVLRTHTTSFDTMAEADRAAARLNVREVKRRG
jgi:hypothetical protein